MGLIRYKCPKCKEYAGVPKVRDYNRTTNSYIGHLLCEACGNKSRTIGPNEVDALVREWPRIPDGPINPYTLMVEDED